MRKKRTPRAIRHKIAFEKLSMKELMVKYGLSNDTIRSYHVEFGTHIPKKYKEQQRMDISSVEGGIVLTVEEWVRQRRAGLI